MHRPLVTSRILNRALSWTSNITGWTAFYAQGEAMKTIEETMLKLPVKRADGAIDLI